MFLHLTLLLVITAGGILDVEEDTIITMKNSVSPQTSPEGPKAHGVPIERKISFSEFREKQLAAERSKQESDWLVETKHALKAQRDMHLSGHYMYLTATITVALMMIGALIYLILRDVIN